MYTFGQKLVDDSHFVDHINHNVPVQIYLDESHKDIGFIQSFSDYFIKLNDTFYNRELYSFISRPGY